MKPIKDFEVTFVDSWCADRNYRANAYNKNGEILGCGIARDRTSAEAAARQNAEEYKNAIVRQTEGLKLPESTYLAIVTLSAGASFTNTFSLIIGANENILALKAEVLEGFSASLRLKKDYRGISYFNFTMAIASLEYMTIAEARKGRFPGLDAALEDFHKAYEQIAEDPSY
jgi:hypothetical protein